MKLNTTPRLKDKDPELNRLHKDIATQVNQLSEGRIEAIYNAPTAAPTTGLHARGDFLRNLEPAELGSVSSKYVIFGWVCVSGGEPGTWKECRFLTGN